MSFLLLFWSLKFVQLYLYMRKIVREQLPDRAQVPNIQIFSKIFEFFFRHPRESHLCFRSLCLLLLMSVFYQTYTTTFFLWLRGNLLSSFSLIVSRAFGPYWIDCSIYLRKKLLYISQFYLLYEDLFNSLYRFSILF